MSQSDISIYLQGIAVGIIICRLIKTVLVPKNKSSLNIEKRSLNGSPYQIISHSDFEAVVEAELGRGM